MYLFVPAYIPLLYRRFNFFSTGRALGHLSVTSFKGFKIKNRREFGSTLNALPIFFLYFLFLFFFLFAHSVALQNYRSWVKPIALLINVLTDKHAP
jgi:hypothetical protein